MRVLKVGQVAIRAGVQVDTVRFYQRCGLIPEPPRTASGYRQYPEETVERLLFIPRAKALGFTLEEIDHKLRNLRAMKAGLADLVDACAGAADPGDCVTAGCPCRGEALELVRRIACHRCRIEIRDMKHPDRLGEPRSWWTGRSP